MKKKILFICNTDWFFVSHRLPIAIEALNSGYEIHIATNLKSKKNYLEKLNINCHNIFFERYKLSPIKDLIVSCKILFLIAKIRPDIVHSITIKPVLLGGLALRIFPKINYIVSISGLGYVFSSDISIKSFLTKFLVKILYLVALRRKNLHMIFQNLNDIKVISNILKKKIDNYTLIPGSGVDLNKYKPKPFPKGEPVILFAARLLKSKGIYEFVNTAKIIKNARFIIVGKFDKESDDSISQNELDDWVNSGIVEYWGFKDDMHEIINLAHMIIFPSFYGEGLPKILIEAAACGRPVITTDQHGCKDSVDNNITGFIVPKRDVNSIVKCVNLLLKFPDKLNKMSKKSRNLAEKKFDIKFVIHKHLIIYKKILS